MSRTALHVFYGISALLLAISLYVHALPIAFGDKIFFLVYSRMWLEGKELYTDLVTVSLPLMFWLYAAPVTLADYAFTDLQWLLLLGLCLLSFSLFISMRLIALHPFFAGSRPRRIEFLILFCFVLIFRANPHYFLDREHLFFALLFPYLLRQMPSLQSAALPVWMRVTIGVMAGLACCFRPQSLIVLAAIAIAVPLRNRSPRTAISLENIITGLTGFVYLLAVYMLYPEYFETITPMALATYSATRDMTPVWDYASNTLSILVPTLLLFPWRSTSPLRSDIYYLLWLCPFFLLFAFAGNNWSYTYYPLSSIALVVTGFVLWELFYLFATDKSSKRSTWLFASGIALCCGTIVFRVWLSLMVFYGLIFYGCYDNPACENDTPFVAEMMQLPAENRSFGAISIDTTRWTHLSRYAHAQWDTRFSQLWMLPQLLVANPIFLDQQHWIIEYIGKGFTDDFNNRKPQIVFVQDTSVFYSVIKQVNLVEYLSVIPEFRDAWKQYEFLHSIDFCGPRGQQYKYNCKFDVYKRIAD